MKDSYWLLIVGAVAVFAVLFLVGFPIPMFQEENDVTGYSIFSTAKIPSAGPYRRSNPHIRYAEAPVEMKSITSLQWKYSQLCKKGNSKACGYAPLLEALAQLPHNVKTPKDLQWFLEDYGYSSLEELWEQYQVSGRLISKVSRYK